jgi:hypothetical protein
MSSTQSDQFKLTQHASIRARQRGIPERLLKLVFEHADISLHAGDGCEHIRLSRYRADELVAVGLAAPDEASKAARLVAVMGRHGVATVVRPESGPRGRRYRRQMSTRSSRSGGRYLSWTM